MKKFTLLLLVVLATSISAYSQTAFQGWTVKAGINLSSLTNKSDIRTSYKTGFTAGLAMDWMFTNVVGMSVDVLYSRQGAKADLIKDVTITEYSNYINLPVLANFRIVEGLTAKAGVQLGWFLSGGDEIKGTDEPQNFDLLSSYKVMDISVPIGLCYEFKHRVSLEVRYHIGLTNIAKESQVVRDFKSYNSYASLTVGYRF